MTIFNALLLGIVVMFIAANLALLVAAVFWAMGGFARFAHVRRPFMAQASSVLPKPSLSR